MNSMKGLEDLGFSMTISYVTMKNGRRKQKKIPTGFQKKTFLLN